MWSVAMWKLAWTDIRFSACVIVPVRPCWRGHFTDCLPSRTKSPSSGGESGPLRHTVACESAAGSRSAHLFPGSYTIIFLMSSPCPRVWLSLWLACLTYSPVTADNETTNTHIYGIVIKVIQQWQELIWQTDVKNKGPEIIAWMWWSDSLNLMPMMSLYCAVPILNVCLYRSWSHHPAQGYFMFGLCRMCSASSESNTMTLLVLQAPSPYGIS